MSHLAQRGRKSGLKNIGAVYAKRTGRHISTVKLASDRRVAFMGISGVFFAWGDIRAQRMPPFWVIKCPV
ncbi:hypothetical protein IBA8401_08730 [Pseudomonas syringae]